MKLNMSKRDDKYKSRKLEDSEQVDRRRQRFVENIYIEEINGPILRGRTVVLSRISETVQSKL